MLRSLSASLGLALISFSTPAYANIKSGNDLLRLCEDVRSHVSWGLCYGYLDGIIDRSYLAESMNPGSQLLCLPDNGTNEQIFDVVIAYLKKHPDKRHFGAGALVVTALREAFCQK